jgi:hypothetical protein
MCVPTPGSRQCSCARKWALVVLRPRRGRLPVQQSANGPRGNGSNTLISTNCLYMSVAVTGMHSRTRVQLCVCGPFAVAPYTWWSWPSCAVTQPNNEDDLVATARMIALSSPAFRHYHNYVCKYLATLVVPVLALRIYRSSLGILVHLLHDTLSMVTSIFHRHMWIETRPCRCRGFTSMVFIIRRSIACIFRSNIAIVSGLLKEWTPWPSISGLACRIDISSTRLLACVVVS